MPERIQAFVHYGYDREQLWTDIYTPIYAVERAEYVHIDKYNRVVRRLEQAHAAMGLGIQTAILKGQR